MADRLVSEINADELAAAVITALRDAGIDYCEDEPINGTINVDGTVALTDLGSHLKRILLLDPPPPAE